MYLNGTLAAPTLLPSTGFNDWDSWGESEFTLELQEGVNTIVFRNRKEDADGLQGDVNYDLVITLLRKRFIEAGVSSRRI